MSSRLSRLAPARRRFWVGVVTAAVLAVLAIVVGQVATREPAVAPVAQDELGPVLLVPGYGGNTNALRVLADLRRAGIVMSQRGQSGGWRMGRPAADVTVADVIRAVDGPLVSVYGLRPESVTYNETADVLQHVWIAARRSLRDVFEAVSIQQLADHKLPKAVTSRTADEDAWQPH